jgi:hypothetical protein
MFAPGRVTAMLLPLNFGLPVRGQLSPSAQASGPARQTFVRCGQREWRIVVRMPQVAPAKAGQSGREGVLGTKQKCERIGEAGNPGLIGKGGLPRRRGAYHAQ